MKSSQFGLNDEAYTLIAKMDSCDIHEQTSLAKEDSYDRSRQEVIIENSFDGFSIPFDVQAKEHEHQKRTVLRKKIWQRFKRVMGKASKTNDYPSF